MNVSPTLTRPTLRAVAGSRVSDTGGKQGKTSHIEQKTTTARYIDGAGWATVGYFEDLDVSAQVSPWERPDLGPWLTDRSDEWDAIVWAKVDRAFRSIFDCVDVARWAEDNKKILVFTDDGLKLDFSDGADDMATMMAKVFLMLASLFAEMELKRIKGRMLATHQHLRGTDRWAGGQAPYGYKIADREGGGKTLVFDLEAVAVIKKIIALVKEKKSFNEIAAILTAQGIDTPSVHRSKALASGYTSRRKTELSNRWQGNGIADLLRHPALMGYKTVGKRGDKRHKRRVIARDKAGMPIQITEGILTEHEFEELQVLVDARSKTGERTMNTAPHLGVAICGGCQERLYLQNGVYKRRGKEYNYAYYRCQARPKTGKPACKGFSFKATIVSKAIHLFVTEELADLPYTRRVFIPGEDHSEELERVVKAMTAVREEKDMDLYDYPGGEEEYKERMTSLAAKRKHLSALPSRTAEWRDEPTDETWADAYGRMDAEERRQLLLEAGVTVVFTKDEEPWPTAPADLMEKMAALAA
ncbi:recombinase family protein [Streptomyces sp. NPDC004732]|uniref:recombinase family protein n=1 Tax=Streptomyces sp. NPDC004732 TaxID=3154290 RepID=UPI0033AE6ECD